MTDMQTAVEVLARALWCRENLPRPEIGFIPPEDHARALLAEIAPLIRADEREACAMVAERRRYSCNTGSPMLDMANAGRTEEASEIAAAIRQRGSE